MPNGLSLITGQITTILIIQGVFSGVILGGVRFLIRSALKGVNDKLDDLNNVDARLEKGIQGHGHRGLEGDNNEVVIRNPTT